MRRWIIDGAIVLAAIALFLAFVAMMPRFMHAPAPGELPEPVLRVPPPSRSR